MRDQYKLSKDRESRIIKTSREVANFKKVKLKEKAKPEEYKYIKAWGEINNTLDYYVNNQQHFASSSRAPLDTVSFSLEGGFKYLSDLNEEDQKKVEELVATM